MQSVLVLRGGDVISGGDSGALHTYHSSVSEDLLAPTTLAGHKAAVMCLDAPGKAGPRVLSGSADHTAVVWDLAAGGARTASLLGHTRSVHCLAVGQAAPFGESVVFTGSRDHTIKLWDLRQPEGATHTLSGHTGSVTCLGVRGWKLASGGGYDRAADDNEVLAVDTSVKLWDLRKLPGSGVGAGTSAAAAAAADASAACVWSRSAYNGGLFGVAARRGELRRLRG